jgi:hypothetical protein
MAFHFDERGLHADGGTGSRLFGTVIEIKSAKGGQDIVEDWVWDEIWPGGRGEPCFFNLFFRVDWLRGENSVC